MSADRACDSCCVFPNFNLNVDQVFNGEDFSLGDTLINDLGIQFKITDYLMIFSAFQLGTGNDVFTVTDSTTVSCNGSSDNYEINDLISINNFSSLKTIGEWKEARSIESISFLLGLNDCYHDAGLSNLDDNSRIADIDTLYQSSGGFKTLILELNDSLRYELIGKAESINITKSIVGSNAAGNPLVMNMTIDFGAWLADFNTEDDTQATKTKLIQNLNQAISFTE